MMMTTNPASARNAIRLAVFSSFLLAVAVLLGAFGAHALTLDAKAMTWWQTATLYFFIHALGALMIGGLSFVGLCGSRLGYCLILGSAIFSGSLYAMALGAPRWLGALTPIGGSLFVLGWLLLGFALIKKLN